MVRIAGLCQLSKKQNPASQLLNFSLHVFNHFEDLVQGISDPISKITRPLSQAVLTFKLSKKSRGP